MVGGGLRDTFLAAAALALLTAGCVPPPQRRDPFESLNVSDALYRNLTLGLIFSENTKNAIRYVDKKCAAGDRTFGGIAPVLQKNFGSVVKIDKVEDAAPAGADLVAILDIYADFSTRIMENYKIDIAAKFMTPDRAEIDTLRTKSVSSGYQICGGVLTKVTERSLAAFEAAVRGWTKLMKGFPVIGNTDSPARPPG